MNSQNIYTVSQVNQYLKSLLDADRTLNRVYVRGEVSNYKRYPSGHHYFSLKDEQCSIRCVMFRSAAARLRFQPENGQKLIAFGRVTVFPRDGAYQLYAEALTPDGVGELAVAFEQLKARLGAEGLFDAAHKKPIPRMPGTVGIITSPAGAAVHDMVRILRERWPMTQVKLLGVRVQGPEAPAEIAGAIAYANRWRVADLLIVGRGGGSLEDLWAFNDERVARAIYASELPVLSAVGHEPDVTISDFVADLRASTPSNAAELAVPDRLEVDAALRGLWVRLRNAQSLRLRGERERLERLRAARVLRDPMAPVNEARLALDHSLRRMAAAQERQLHAGRERLSGLTAALDAMSPLKVLSRGYTVAERAGRPLSSVRELEPGEPLTVRFHDGRALCSVNEIEVDETKE